MAAPNFEDIPQDINAPIRAHIKQHMTDPEKAHLWDARPLGLPGPVTILLLTTTGRKTGEKRNVPLLYVDHEGGYLIIGSKGGNVDHPVWYLNLLADPECEVGVSTSHSKARARVLAGDERAKAWAKVAELQPTYAKYQDRAVREIPVVKLVPAAA